jgi:hypothetical protein
MESREVGEERRAEILENRKTFRKLNKAIMQGRQQTRTVEVTDRNGEQLEVTLRPLVDVELLEISEKLGLTDQDFATAGMTKAASKLRFMDKVIVTAIVESEELRPAEQDIAELLAISERAKLFTAVAEMSGLTPAAVADVEKFRGKPSQPSP